MYSPAINLKDYASYTFELSYDHQLSCVVMKIEGFMEGEIFRNNTEKMLALLKEKKTNKVLVIAKEMKFIRLEDCKWLENEFLPRAIREGFRVCSFVKPLDYHAMLSIENIIYQIPLPLMEAAWFNKEQEARDWIKGN